MVRLVSQWVGWLSTLTYSSFFFQGTLPFPGQNVALIKYGSSCTSNAVSYFGRTCDLVFDGDSYSYFSVAQTNISILLTFSQAYVVNKVSFHGFLREKYLTIKFSDKTSKKVKFPKCID